MPWRHKPTEPAQRLNGWPVHLNVDDQNVLLRPGDTVQFCYQINVPAEVVWYLETRDVQPHWRDILADVLRGRLMDALRRRLPPGIHVHQDADGVRLDLEERR